MSAACKVCQGSGERLLGTGIYDCAAPGCDAATVRAALEDSFPASGVSHPMDTLWLGYQSGSEARDAYWRNMFAGLTHVATAAERAEADKHRQHSAVYSLQEAQELRARLDAITNRMEK